MKIRLYRESAAAILGAVFLLTLAAGVYPAIKAGRVLPVEAIKDI
jgi:ABC-type lipoprotein release transport system permease subunit